MLECLVWVPVRVSSAWVLDTHVGDSDGVSDFWLWPNPAQGILYIWEVKQQMETFSFSLCNCVFQTKTNTYIFLKDQGNLYAPPTPGITLQL